MKKRHCRASAIFENREIRKVTNDAKNFILRLHKLGVSINGLDLIRKSDLSFGAYQKQI